ERRAAVSDELVEVEHASMLGFPHSSRLVTRRLGEVAHDHGSDLAAHVAAIAVGGAEVDAAPYARVLDLLRHLGELAIGPRDTQRHRERHVDVDVVASEEAAQDGLCGP